MSVPSINAINKNANNLFHIVCHLAFKTPTYSSQHISNKVIPFLKNIQHEICALTTQFDSVRSTVVYDQETENIFTELQDTINKTFEIWDRVHQHCLDACKENSSKRQRDEEITETANQKAQKIENDQESLRDDLSYLPGELLLNILQYISPEDFFTMSQVSKGFQGFCNADGIWKPVLSNQMMEVDPKTKDDYFHRIKIRIKMTVLANKISKGIYTTRKLIGHSSSINALCKVSNFLCSQSSDGMIKIWDPTTESCIATLQKHQHSVEYSHKGRKFLLFKPTDKTIKILDLGTKRQASSFLFEHPNDTDCKYMDGNFLYCCPKNGNINIFDATTSKPIALLPTLSSVRNLYAENDVLYFSFAKPQHPYSASDENVITILDFRVSYSDLLNVADKILHQGDLTRLLAFGEACKNAIYDELATMDNLQLDFGEECFLDGQEQFNKCFSHALATMTNEKKAQAIYRYVAKHIVYLLEKGSRRLALDLFKKLPEAIKLAIYTELSAIEESSLHPEIAFLSLNGQDTTNEKRIEAIHNYLNK